LSDVQIKLIRIGNIIIMMLWTILLISIAIDTFTPDPPLPDIEGINAVVS